MLNTIHLQTFLAVVEAGNYSAAADRLHMSQPAVSQHIRSLEQYLDNVRLFRRVGRAGEFLECSESADEATHRVVAVPPEDERRLEARIRAVADYQDGAWDLWEEVREG